MSRWHREINCLFLFCKSSFITLSLRFLIYPTSGLTFQQSKPIDPAWLTPHVSSIRTRMCAHAHASSSCKQTGTSRHSYTYTEQHTQPYKVATTGKHNHTHSLKVCLWAPLLRLSQKSSLRGLAFKYAAEPQIRKLSSLESAWFLLFVLS